MRTKSLRSGTHYFGKERLGFSHKELGTNSIWYGFAMEIYLSKVYPETIMIIGPLARSAFLQYICIQVSDLRKGIITLTKNNQALYTIPEIEVFYHTPGHDYKEPKRLNLHRQGR